MTTDDEDEDFPDENLQAPRFETLDAACFARETGELLRLSGVPAIWEEQCRRSHQEACSRVPTDPDNLAVRESLPLPLPPGEFISPCGPLPLSRRRCLSVADSYLLLAAIYSMTRRDAVPIKPFAEDDLFGGIFWYVMRQHARELRALDAETLRECVCVVRSDLRERGLLCDALTPAPTRFDNGSARNVGELTTPHADGVEGGRWLWWGGQRYDLPTGQIPKLIHHFWGRDASNYETIFGKDVLDSVLEPSSVRSVVSRANGHLDAAGVPWRLASDSVGRVVTKVIAPTAGSVLQ